MSESPAYFVFDVESVADAALISKVHFGGKVPVEEAVRKYRDELMAQNNTDFIPYTFQYPVSIVIAKVAKDFSLLDIVVLDEPACQPHEICNKFWRGWMAYKQPTLISFNGRGFDIPMLELAAFRYGISIPQWFALETKSFDQPRYRYNTKVHLDLYDILTNYGATRFSGGLNLAASLLGKPGKMDTQGFMVQDMYDAGKLSEINDYCRCDVLDTYFVFLRTMVLIGNLSLADEQQLVKNTRQWIEQQSEAIPVYRQYLDNWGDWWNPWEAS
ncbi:MAG: 3'-5' exonuclease [Planctomycetaceae bacterium]|jgi:predicted PolB exonuclease-like 3'-5' exonuclease|nr:3'-5' exonuclease [Planctomycetaceae bacterium]